VTSVIRLRVNGKFNDALLDSGANQSVVDYTCARKLGAYIEPLGPHSTQNLMTANSQWVKVIGEAVLEFQIEQIKIKQRFNVIKNCSSEIICGMDFIVQNGINCAHADGHMTLRGGSITVPFIRKNSYLGIAYLADSIKIPPGGSKLVKLWLRHEPKEGEHIRLQALSNAPALVQIQPTTIVAG
jgi:hypothetical protein